ncbi:Glutaredoxin [Halobacillus karajensis]|uniref:glutaredoxin family protein n=1 Tax=Halobacillus karajensis TaxID=195088 RepID=UPI0008A7517D|nr:glutaredoxin family protein [Halobacillus karajensis]SEH39103.1 Glutaredoxin [Halobacillus karajensis]
MHKVVLFEKKNCGLCKEVKDLLSLFDVTVEEVNIEKDSALMEKYMFEVPVLLINGEELDYRTIDYMELEKRFQ